MGKRLHDWVVTTWYGDTRRGRWLLPLAWLFAGVSRPAARALRSAASSGATGHAASS